MKPLNLGDKVAFYEQGFRMVGEVTEVVTSGDAEGRFVIHQAEVGIFWQVHRKQVRLLKKKKKRREFWVGTCAVGLSRPVLTERPHDLVSGAYIHVREVRENETK